MEYAQREHTCNRHHNDRKQRIDAANVPLEWRARKLRQDRRGFNNSKRYKPEHKVLILVAGRCFARLSHFVFNNQQSLFVNLRFVFRSCDGY